MKKNSSDNQKFKKSTAGLNPPPPSKGGQGVKKAPAKPSPAPPSKNK